MKKKLAIYPGTFDPITNGHLDLIERGLRIFDDLIIAVAPSTKKQPLFDLSERTAMIKNAVRKYKNVKVESFHGLLVEYASSKDGIAVIRGLRAVSDFENEFQMALMNRRLDMNIETVFSDAVRRVLIPKLHDRKRGSHHSGRNKGSRAGGGRDCVARKNSMYLKKGANELLFQIMKNVLRTKLLG